MHNFCFLSRCGPQKTTTNLRSAFSRYRLVKYIFYLQKYSEMSRPTSSITAKGYIVNNIRPNPFHGLFASNALGHLATLRVASHNGTLTWVGILVTDIVKILYNFSVIFKCHLSFFLPFRSWSKYFGSSMFSKSGPTLILAWSSRLSYASYVRKIPNIDHRRYIMLYLFVTLAVSMRWRLFLTLCWYFSRPAS